MKQCLRYPFNINYVRKGEHRLRAFENRLRRRMFGPKGEEITRITEVKNEEHLNLYSSFNIVIAIQSRGMRWFGNVACMANQDVCTKLWLEDFEEGES
jgi:hypothetical protein